VIRFVDSVQRRLRRWFWVGLWHLRHGIKRGLLAIGRGVVFLTTPLWLAALIVGLLIAARLSRRFRGGQRLYWGPDPLPHYKYISDAMRAAGFETKSIVTPPHPIFRGIDFDAYESDVIEASRLPQFIARRAAAYVVFLHLLKHYDIAHIAFTGGPLGRTRLASLEPRLFRIAGIRTVMLPYGMDFWRYSWVTEGLMRHAFLIDYPEPGRNEEAVERRVKRWMRHGDLVAVGVMIEGASRWDVGTTDFNIVPPDRVRPRDEWSRADGRNEPVQILHTPNHRGVKGTEFIVEAVHALQARGYRIDFVLPEQRLTNEEVLDLMRRVDICVDHCIGSGWGLFAVEALGSGSVVMANLEDEHRLGVHRVFGWLNQSPLVSANIEQLEETLEYLITSPDVREELGRIGIEYVRRFHSAETAQYLFGSIYRKLAGEDVDLMRLFHPLTSEYMQRFEPLRPPLERNRPRALVRGEWAPEPSP
jgi:hypothetical protein